MSLAEMPTNKRIAYLLAAVVQKFSKGAEVVLTPEEIDAVNGLQFHADSEDDGRVVLRVVAPKGARQ